MWRRKRVRSCVSGSGGYHFRRVTCFLEDSSCSSRNATARRLSGSREARQPSHLTGTGYTHLRVVLLRGGVP